MNYLLTITPSLIEGLKVTMQVFCWTLIGSIPLGIIVALGAVSKIKLLAYIIDIYIWIMRGTPLLLQMIFIFFGLPTLNIVFDRFEAVMFSFILNYAAYFAEIFRGGLLSIDKGQFESAKVLGLTYWQTAIKIIIPQVFKRVFPSVANEIISLVKDTSLIYVLGLGDLLRAGKIASNREATLIPLFAVGAIYLFIVAIFTFIFKRIELRLNYYK